MNPNQLKRLFPNASKSTIKANQDDSGNPRVSNKPKQVAGKRAGETLGSKTMGTQYRLCRCEISFHASHGQILDEDNRRFIAKPILDALVNLGFARNDKDITSETTQRPHPFDFGI